MTTENADIRSPKPGKKHLIRNTPLRRVVKVLLGVVVFILLIPVLIYIPPVQTMLKDLACHIVGESTGMKVSIDEFRLKWPLDVELAGVQIIEASGDTMVTARSLVADVKLRPLLKGDVQVKKIELLDGSYRMLSADSSMLLTLSAGYLRTEQGTDFNLRDMHLRLRRPVLRDANVNVSMNVWKQKKDTTSTPTKFVIEADRLLLENVTYSMQMLPTIASLSATIGKGEVKDALINLTDGRLSFGSVDVSGGKASYLTPTPEYVKTHPAPVDSTPSTSPPMTITIGRATLGFDSVLYATQGAVPQPGFDASYVQVTNLEVAVDSFYNCASTLRLPIASLRAKERSGLEITSGSGLLAIDATGLQLGDLSITTPASSLKATATLPFELMAMKAGAPAGNVVASGNIGWSDIFSFMPSLRGDVRKMLAGVPLSSLRFSLDGAGTMSKLHISRLNLAMGRFMSLSASGDASNFLSPSRLQARLDFDGSLQEPSATRSLLQNFTAALQGVNVPTLRLRGRATANAGLYTADAELLTSAGEMAAKGSVALSSEQYDIDARLHALRVGEVMPSLGIGTLTGTLHASGAGFNPLLPHADAEVELHLTQGSYAGQEIAPLSLNARIDRGVYDIDMTCTAPHLNLDLTGSGHIEGNTYYIEMTTDMRYVDLQAFGLVPERCQGSGKVSLRGHANPADMLFDLDMSVNDVDWEYADDYYHLPYAFDAGFVATAQATTLQVAGDKLNIDFNSPTSLKDILAQAERLSPEINRQLEAKQVDFEQLQAALPPFSLNLDAEGSGLLAELLDDSGYDIGSISASFTNDSTLNGHARLLTLNSSSLSLDTLTMNLSQRGSLLDYRLHMGNRPGTMPEFAQVTATGYLGGNRASIFLRQSNDKGETGYRLGLTAAMLDSMLSVHLTPVKAVIGYKNWQINDDNYIELGPGRRIAGEVEASTGGSSIALHTSQTDSLPAVDIDIKNLLIQDFLPLFAPDLPMTGAINSKMHLVYRGVAVTGQGSLGVAGLTYDSQRVGDIDFNFKAGMGFNGNVGASLALLLNEREVITARGYFLADTTATAVRNISITQRAKLDVLLHEFPMDVANPFLPQDVMRLAGNLNGQMTLTGALSAPMLNGSITCDGVGLYVPMASSWVRLDSVRTIDVVDNTLNFNNFNLHFANENPVVLNGSIDAGNLADITFDLSLAGNDVAVVNNNKRSADIYGKLFIDLTARAKGSLQRMNIDGNLSVLPATDIFYTLATASSTNLSQQSNTTDVVKFVQFSDTTKVAEADSLKTSTTAMRITAALNIVQGATVTVNLSTNGTDKVQLSPYGNLSYLQTYMGDMRLNGTLYLGSGFARYSVQVIGEKLFNIDQGSYATWTGELLNPTLHINATDHVKANVQQEGANSRLIYFDVSLAITGTLNSPNVAFDLSTDDDITVQNELQGMTAEQRSASAINLLLYNTYTGPGVKASANLGGNPLYSFLEGRLNSLAAKYITGVDLSFGIDQYDKTVDGQTSGTTSYSYQVSKSLFDNRFKIVVGGNYSTDTNADENFAQNLISDVSFEYALRSTATSQMLLRLFRHTGYESILEGEVTETGVGFAYKRKLSNLRSLFRFRRRKAAPDSTSTDTSAPAGHWQKVALPTINPDSLPPQ